MPEIGRSSMFICNGWLTDLWPSLIMLLFLQGIRRAQEPLCLWDIKRCSLGLAHRKGQRPAISFLGKWASVEDITESTSPLGAHGIPRCNWRHQIEIWQSLFNRVYCVNVLHDNIDLFFYWHGCAVWQNCDCWTLVDYRLLDAFSWMKITFF